MAFFLLTLCKFTLRLLAHQLRSIRSRNASRWQLWPRDLVGDQRDMGNPAIHDSLDGFWWENLQETRIFTMKYGGFLSIVPTKPIQWMILFVGTWCIYWYHIFLKKYNIYHVGNIPLISWISWYTIDMPFMGWYVDWDINGFNGLVSGNLHQTFRCSPKSIR